ncbi:MAG: FAD-dependent oxidoreductase [Candidatus Micrarchaeia archaeon]
MSNDYDVMIIGAGCAGLSAAMYAGRFGLKTICFGEMPGGTITTTDAVENFPGIKSISGLELGNRLLEHAKEYKVPIKMEKVEAVKKKGALFELKTDSGEYVGKTVIFATGTQWRKLGAPGEKELANRGVHYCALCDGAFYKDKKIAVIGAGDSAAKESQLLCEFGSKVYIIAREEKLSGEPVNVKRALQNKKIELMTLVEVKEFVGKEKLEGLKLTRKVKPAGEAETDFLKVDAAFIMIGNIAKSELAKEIGVKLNEKGEIIVDRMANTNLTGVFAAGDVSDGKFKQAIASVAEGSLAAYSAYKYLERKG